MPGLHQEHHFESAICDHLGQHGWLYAEGDAAVAHLRRAGLIEGRKPNFYVAAHIAATLNEQASYTRNRGLEKDRLKEFVLSQLRQFDGSKRENLDNLLLPMLPAGLTEQQKRDKVKNLLTEMRVNDQTVSCFGRGPAAVWKVLGE